MCPCSEAEQYGTACPAGLPEPSAAEGEILARGTCPAGLPEPSAAEEGLLARGNNNAEQAVWDRNKRSAEDSVVVHHRYWSPSVVTAQTQKKTTTDLQHAQPTTSH